MPRRTVKGNLLENLVPVLLLASIILAFVVGVLWQKVSSLESGSLVRNTAQENVGAAANPPSQPTKLNDLAALAVSAGVDEDDFSACFESKKYADKVEEVYQGGLAVGITGTPGSIILNSGGEAWLIPGALPYEDVSVVVDKALGRDVTVAEYVVQLTSEQLANLPPVTSADYVKGNRNGQVFLIEYSDYECPFCTRFHPTAQKVVDTYSEAAWVYRHFPLDQLHPNARPAAEAAECVGELGGEDAFWKFTDEIFSS
jgi:protein-disulfide isomerase